MKCINLFTASVFDDLPGENRRLMKKFDMYVYYAILYYLKVRGLPGKMFNCIMCTYSQVTTV